MLAKKTAKNQITLPKAIVRQLPDVDSFEVSLREGAVVLRPAVVRAAAQRLTEIRSKIRALGLTEKDIDAAIRWARRASRLMRVVLDSNTIVSALLFSGTASHWSRCGSRGGSWSSWPARSSRSTCGFRRRVQPNPTPMVVDHPVG